MQTIVRPRLRVKAAPGGKDYDLLPEAKKLQFIEAVHDKLGSDFAVYLVQVDRGRRIERSRPMLIGRFVDVLTNFLLVQEPDGLNTTIKEAKDRAMQEGWALLRGPYGSRYSPGGVPNFICWLIFDYDQGIRPVDFQRLDPFLHFWWCTTSYTGTGPQKARVAIPIVPVDTVEQHEELRAYFMGDYPAHHDDVSRLAIMPVQRVGPDGTRSPLRIVGHIGEEASLAAIRALSGKPVEDAPVGDAPEPGPKRKVRPSVPLPPMDQLSVLSRAHMTHWRRLAGLCDIKLADGASLNMETVASVSIHCPFGNHEDAHPSATLHVHLDKSGNPNLWVTCFSHFGGGTDHKPSLTMPLVRLYRQKFGLHRPRTINAVPTAAQQAMLMVRMLYELSLPEVTNLLPWSANSDQIIKYAETKGVEIIPPEPGRRERMVYTGDDTNISMEVLSFQKAYVGTNILFACNHFLHGRYNSTISTKFMGDWCRLEAKTYFNCRKLLIALGLIELVDRVPISKRPSRVVKGTVTPNNSDRTYAGVYAPIQV